MVATATRPSQAGSESTEFEQLTSRRRRRPGWILAGIALVALSMLVGVLLFTWTATTEKMLAVNEDIAAGHVMTAQDLRVVDVNPDQSFATISASEQNKIIGQAAVGNMPEGTLISEEMFTAPSIALVEGKVNIPYAAEQTRLPIGIDSGSSVRMYSAIGDSNDGLQGGAAPLGAATVVSVATAEGSSVQVITLLVDSGAEAEVVQAIADNNLRLVLVGSS